MELKLEVTPLMKVNVKINGHDLGEFNEESRWQGMVKLSSPRGFIIADDDQNFVGSIFSGMWRESKNETKTLTIFKISPDLIPVDVAEKLQEEETP